MKRQRKKHQYTTDILREKIDIDEEERDIVFETVEEVLVKS
jgi:hypothetical protein